MVSLVAQLPNGGWFPGVAKILGKILALIHNSLGINNVAVSIIVITIVIYMLLLPLTYKQQKFSKISNKINPELQAIQKKYQGKTDDVSRMKMNNEMQALYDKYGVSQMGSCVQLLVQMPILFAMYTLIRNIDVFIKGDNMFLGLDIQLSPMQIIGGDGVFNTIIVAFREMFQLNTVVILAFLIPILSGLSQWISVKVSMSGQKIDTSNPAMASMKMMNSTMPIISTIMVFTLPVGLGLYWTMSAIVRTVQQALLNVHFNRMDFDAIVEKNREKAAEKQAKREGYLQSTIAQSGKMNTRNMSSADTKEALDRANQARANAKPGSMASKANLVRDFNEKNSSK